MSDLPSLSKPPLNFLINPKTARRGKPWEIDISDLLTIFIDFIDIPPGIVVFLLILLLFLKEF